MRSIIIVYYSRYYILPSWLDQSKIGKVPLLSRFLLRLWLIQQSRTNELSTFKLGHVLASLRIPDSDCGRFPSLSLSGESSEKRLARGRALRAARRQRRGSRVIFNARPCAPTATYCLARVNPIVFLPNCLKQQIIARFQTHGIHVADVCTFFHPDVMCVILTCLCSSDKLNFFADHAVPVTAWSSLISYPIKHLYRHGYIFSFSFHYTLSIEIISCG